MKDLVMAVGDDRLHLSGDRLERERRTLCGKVVRRVVAYGAVVVRVDCTVCRPAPPETESEMRMAWGDR